LRRAEVFANKSRATRKGWLNDAGKSFHILKDVYNPNLEHDAEVLDDGLSLVGLMYEKKKFAAPTRDELVSLMEKEEIVKMSYRWKLLSDEEREEARNEGRNEGKIEWKRERVSENYLLERSVFVFRRRLPC